MTLKLDNEKIWPKNCNDVGPIFSVLDTVRDCNTFGKLLSILKWAWLFSTTNFLIGYRSLQNIILEIDRIKKVWIVFKLISSPTTKFHWDIQQKTFGIA